MTTWPGLCCTPRSATCSRSCKEGKHGRDLRSPSHCACAQRIPREIRHPAPERRRAGAALGLIFTPEFRNPDALRGIEGFDRLWLIWEFSANRRASWSPTVRPPRLGGNTRLGVFATRSPFRPNPLGMSCVVLTGVRQDAKLGPVLCLSGADLMDGTPVFDIKPYLPYSDCFPDARAGFTALAPDLLLGVDFPPELLERIRRRTAAPCSACCRTIRGRPIRTIPRAATAWASRALTFILPSPRAG